MTRENSQTSYTVSQSIKKIYPHGVYIFVVPPTWEELEKRLQERASDSPEERKIRIKNAKKELEYLSYYDYLVLNDSLEKAVLGVSAIIQSESHRLTRINKKDIPILN